MGKKKDKKKGKGAEKTAAKTEKKAMQKAKKELAAKGEDDIEKLIAEFKEKDQQQNVVGEENCSPPSARSGFSLCAHPERDELLLFGGEYFNGSKTEMYNDLYFYNIKKNQWSILRCTDKPPPRCAHQAVTLSQGNGQLWIFGGEFASPTRSNFHHYKDLWVYHLSDRRWEQVKVSGGPSSRSGHRMVVNHKNLVVFGGFHESIRDYKYFNDVHVFDLENYQWTKIDVSGSGPSPRSGCQMAPLSDGRVLLYGGYSREKVKKDVDKGVSHSDMYLLQLDAKSTVPKWKWASVKQTGIQPVARSGFSITVASNNRAFLFGGVHDEEDDDEDLTGIFHNDLHALEMEKGRWLPIVLHGKTETTERKRRRKEKSDVDEDMPEEGESVEENAIQQLSITDESEAKQVETKTYEDSVFTVKVGLPSSSPAENNTASALMDINPSTQPFIPHPRMNAAMVVKHSILYLYGGIYEDGDKQLTLTDFYSLDLHKLDEWKTIISSSIENIEWCESEQSSSEDEEGAEPCDDDDDDDIEEEESRNIEKMDIA